MTNAMEKMLNSFGVMSETLWIFFSRLKDTGFTEDQAMTICMSYMNTLLTFH